MSGLVYRIFMIATIFGCTALLSACSEEPHLENIQLEESKSSYELTASANDEISESRQNALTRTVAKASPAIVGINVTDTKRVPVRSFFRWYYQNREVRGLGSGFIISPDGFVLTNHHVAGEADEILITLTSGDVYEAEVVGTDYVSDISLLKIKTEEALPYIELADDNGLMVGEWAIAFGNPFGLFENNSKPTVTLGVVSNYGLNFLHEEGRSPRVYRDMIQTDAAISSGNSGGPLLNADGKVIGMNTTIFSTSQSSQGAGSIGIGFAIPAHRIKKIISMLKTGRPINRSFSTGMVVNELDSGIRNYLDLDRNARGVFVSRIAKGSAAHEAGIVPGDIIISVGGLDIHRSEDYNVAIFDAIRGDTLSITLIREGETIETAITLDK